MAAGEGAGGGVDAKLLLYAAALLLVAAVGLAVRAPWLESRPLKVGILHSLSGTMAVSEKPVVDATLLAIAEINAEGGVLGRQIEPLVRDGASDPEIFARQAEALIATDHVVTLFGCWTSASRKAVRPVVERTNNLLFYPVQYEGLESSANIIYLGAAPNQQIIPAVRWAMDKLKVRRFFLLGSDYVFPRAANAIIHDQVQSLRGEIVGEAYLPLGGTDMTGIIEAIRQSQPQLILNTVNGDSNLAFFTALRQAGFTAESLPTLSFSLAENELQFLGPRLTTGDYAAWNYFQSLPGEVNDRFVTAFHQRYGAGRSVDDPMEAAYLGVYLWAQAVRDAQSVDPPQIRAALLGQSLLAPEGLVSVDETSQHLWKPVRIGRIRADGQFTIVWDSETPVQPNPFPPFRLRRDWQDLLDGLRLYWGGWSRPQGPSTPLILKPVPS